jgi:hypothetical protein
MAHELQGSSRGMSVPAVRLASRAPQDDGAADEVAVGRTRGRVVSRSFEDSKNFRRRFKDSFGYVGIMLIERCLVR